MITMPQYPFEKILKNTHEFAKLIDDENWDELESRVEKRQRDLEAVFSSEIEEEHKSNYLDFIQQIQLADMEHKKKIEKIKNSLSGEMNELRSSFHAIQAYMNVDGE